MMSEIWTKSGYTWCIQSVAHFFQRILNRTFHQRESQRHVLWSMTWSRQCSLVVVSRVQYSVWHSAYIMKQAAWVVEFIPQISTYIRAREGTDTSWEWIKMTVKKQNKWNWFQIKKKKKEMGLVLPDVDGGQACVSRNWHKSVVGVVGQSGGRETYFSQFK